MTTTARSRYSTVMIILHWLIAALVIANLAIGILHEDMARETRRFWMGQHFSIGMSVLILSVLLIVWRLTHRPPPPIAEHAAWERTLAKIVQSLFYIMLIAMPVLGWIMMSAGADSNPVDVFGVFGMPPLPIGENEAAGDLAGELHELGAWLFLGLVALHILGAFKHQFLDRDRTLHRMLPGG